MSRLGQQLTVQLRPALAELERRVAEESRASKRKLRDVDALKAYLASYDVYEEIHDSDLAIDNTSLSPEAVVNQIREHFGF